MTFSPDEQELQAKCEFSESNLVASELVTMDIVSSGVG